jgi:ankyrin repeat protein
MFPVGVLSMLPRTRKPWMLVWLLDKGADPNAKTLGFNRPGRTALHLAAAKKSSAGPQMVKALLEKGAKPNLSTTAGGNTPLHHAVESGSIDTVKILLSHPKDPANLNETNWPSATALHKAAAIPGWTL